MRFGNSFGFSSYFGKVYRESWKSNILVHFRRLPKRRKCVDCWKYRLFRYNFRNFRPFLEPFWPFLEPKLTIYVENSGIFLIYIPSNVENVENVRNFWHMSKFSIISVVSVSVSQNFWTFETRVSIPDLFRPSKYRYGQNTGKVERPKFFDKRMALTVTAA